MKPDLQTHSKRMGAQVANIKGAAAAEAKEADKGDNIVVDKDDSKQDTLKTKQSAHHLKREKKEDSSKRIEPLDDSIDEYSVCTRVRTVRRLLMLHPLTLQRSHRKSNKKMILMVPVTKG